MANWKDVAVGPEAALGDAIGRVDAAGLQVAVIVGPGDTLLGILTDGDIRRAILAGKPLTCAVSEVMTREPMTCLPTTPREELLALMRRTTHHHLPLVDAKGRIVGLVTVDDLVGAVERPNWVVLMAGGLGTRLQPLTNDIPKPLLSVGGKPILETILEGFAQQGFKRVFLSINYKAEMIKNHFGNGERWGVQVEYLHESQGLGTVGALSLLPQRPDEPIVVMNGDVLTHTNFENLLHFHNSHNATATMAVREYDFQVPYGVVRLEGTRIASIEEKPVQRFFVNAGIYALSPEALELVPADTPFDMPTLFEQLIAAGKTTAAYPLREYWLDIGRLDEFERAQREWVMELAGKVKSGGEAAANGRELPAPKSEPSRRR